MNDFRLPESLRESGDPIEGNPFQPSDARYKVWADATRSAERELCDLNSLFVKGVPTEPAAFGPWLVDLAAGKFDIWAKRHIHVIRSDSEVRAFDQWLFNYAQSWLEELPKGLDRAAIEWNPPAPADVTTLRVNLRLRLIERIEHWKGEARRYVVEQKAHEERVEAGLLGVHSKRLEGAKLVDCLREAYDVFASSYARAGQQLTEKLLNQTIPSLVFGAAIQHKWIPYPLVRPVGRRVVGNFLEGWYDRSRSRYVVVPERELTETFGGYKVTQGYEARFRGILEGRIAFWEAEALRRAAAGGLPRAGEPGEAAVRREEGMAPQPETATSTVLAGGSNRCAAGGADALEKPAAAASTRGGFAEGAMELTLEGLPPEVRQVIEAGVLQIMSEVHRLDSEFSERFAHAQWPNVLDLLESHFLTRFDLVAKALLPACDSADPATITYYKQYLDKVDEKNLDSLSQVLRPMATPAREDIRSKVAVRLNARKLKWLADAEQRRSEQLLKQSAALPAISRDALMRIEAANQGEAASASKPQGEQEQKQLTVIDSSRPESPGAGALPSEGTQAGGAAISPPAAEAGADTAAGQAPLRWEDIEVTFLNEFKVQIRKGNRLEEPQNYADLGFADRRAGKQSKPNPNKAWATFRVLAEERGVIPMLAKRQVEWTEQAGWEWARVEKRVQEIRTRLRDHCGIPGEPLPFIPGTGYRALFKIGCGPYYHA